MEGISSRQVLGEGTCVTTLSLSGVSGDGPAVTRWLRSSPLQRLRSGWLRSSALIYLSTARQITASSAPSIDCATLLRKYVTTLRAYRAIQVRGIYAGFAGFLPVADNASHVVAVLLDNESAALRAGISQGALVQNQVAIWVGGTVEERSASASSPPLHDVAFTFRLRTRDSDRL